MSSLVPIRRFRRRPPRTDLELRSCPVFIDDFCDDLSKPAEKAVNYRWARVDGVDDVQVKDIRSLDGGGFRALAEWRADARAGHWGHLHQRRMRFRAHIELRPAADAWKPTGLTVVDVRQDT